MSEALEREAREHGWILLQKRIGPDHVALVVKAWPGHSPELIVGRFKAAGESVRRQLGGEFSHTSLWARGYAATTDIELLDGLLAELLGGPRKAPGPKSQEEHKAAGAP
jgi:hypothetical protein